MASTREEIQAAIRRAAAAQGEGYAARAAAIERLEVHAIERLGLLSERAALPADLEGLEREAIGTRQRLERANERVVARLGLRIASGRTTPAGMRRALSRLAGPPGDETGYDALDELVGALFGAGPPASESVVLEPEMVFYQPTPARAILSLVERANLGPGDALCDLGSGLGHVVLLVALLSGARARGVEIEPAYVEHAAACARRLDVQGVEFLQGDARRASFAEATVFFMYTPFRGAMLDEVLEALRREAARRAFRVCTIGPCTAAVAEKRWLRPAGERASGEHEIAVFHTEGASRP